MIPIMWGADPVTQDYSIGDIEKKWPCCGSLGQAGCWENLVIAASENNGSPIPPLKLIDTAQGLFGEIDRRYRRLEDLMISLMANKSIINRGFPDLESFC